MLPSWTISYSVHESSLATEVVQVFCTILCLLIGRIRFSFSQEYTWGILLEAEPRMHCQTFRLASLWWTDNYKIESKQKRSKRHTVLIRRIKAVSVQPQVNCLRCIPSFSEARSFHLPQTTRTICKCMLLTFFYRHILLLTLAIFDCRITGPVILPKNMRWY